MDGSVVAHRYDRSGTRCPLCARPATVGYVNVHGCCQRCVIGGTRRDDHREITGREKKLLLAEFAAWLDAHPSPWQRATGVLVMGVPAGGGSWWP